MTAKSALTRLARNLFPRWNGSIERVPVDNGRGGMAMTWGMTNPGTTILGASRAQAEATLREMAAE